MTPIQQSSQMSGAAASEESSITVHGIRGSRGQQITCSPKNKLVTPHPGNAASDHGSTAMPRPPRNKLVAPLEI